MRTLVVALVVIAPLAGCAAFRGVQAKDSEELLGAAGFRAELAESPAQLADLHGVPPLKMITHSVDGIVVYRYADPYHCCCFYVGGPAEYAAYERLVVQKRIADGWRDAAWDWPWGPWGGGMW
jgi:hypothetical protein